MKHKIYIETIPDLSIWASLGIVPPAENRVEYEICEKTLTVYKNGFMLSDSQRDTANKVRELYKELTC